jgi:hypothetical protein
MQPTEEKFLLAGLAVWAGLRPSHAASRVISKHLGSLAHFVMCHYDAATEDERKNQRVIQIKP